MTIPTIYDLRTERGPLCEYCKERQAEQRHHCLVPDRKRFHEEVTVKENLMAVCAYCHTGICVLDRREVRIWFYDVQCNRYGVDHMEDWLKSLPAKLWISGRIDFIGNENIRLGSVRCFHNWAVRPGLLDGNRKSKRRSSSTIQVYRSVSQVCQRRAGVQRAGFRGSVRFPAQHPRRL